MSKLIASFKDQWGGKISNGEEMWWSGVWPELLSGGLRGRIRFFLDPRHNILLSYFSYCFQRLNSPNPKIVDFGCGTGGGTLNFSIYLRKPITGYDIFPTQLEVAREQNLASKTNCSFQLLDKNGAIPATDNSIDIIFSSDVLGHVPSIEATVTDWSRALKPGGFVVLFTEASCSTADNSVLANLARQGIDLIAMVPEHISLEPRESLERHFERAGLTVIDRKSASVAHFFLSPKDYVLGLRQAGETSTMYYYLAKINYLMQKITPFYPKPQQIFRTFLIRAFGKNAYGCNYFYLLQKTMTTKSELTLGD